MTDVRPPLTLMLDVADFRAFYWLKEELLQFCHEQNLSGQGSKQDLTERIAHFLATGERQAPLPKPRYRKMPTKFTRDTIIEVSWRCTEDLRAFLQAEIGSHFHFNQIMRDFITREHGKTLDEAIQVWETAYAAPSKTTIAAQFEYNQHTRNYYQQHPNATRAEVIEAWKTLRAKRRSP